MLETLPTSNYQVANRSRKMTEQDCKPVPPRVQNLTGNRYGRWLVIGYAGKQEAKHHWLCECECGTIKRVNGESMRRFKSSSCGCYQKERAAAGGQKNTTHGLRNAPEYAVWRSMKARCYNPKHMGYPHYGGRGIAVCSRWINSFANFIADMGKRPSPEHSIERTDNNGDYTPNNCRWATPKEQGRNQRSNHLIAFRGETHTISEWAEIAGINHKTLRTRINTRKWSIEKALTEPPQHR